MWDRSEYEEEEEYPTCSQTSWVLLDRTLSRDASFDPFACPVVTPEQTSVVVPEQALVEAPEQASVAASDEEQDQILEYLDEDQE